MDRILKISCLSLTDLPSNLNRLKGVRITYLTRNSGVLRFLAERKNGVERYLKILLCCLVFGIARAELNGAALESYLQAQRLYSEAIAGSVGSSISNLKLEVWFKVIDAASSAVTLAPKEPEPSLLRAQVFTRIQLWQKADAAWRAYFALTEGSSASRALMANVQFELALKAREAKKLNEAVAYLEQAVFYNPQKQKAWSLLGRSSYEAGRFALASEACLRALELNPNDQTAIYYLKLARAKP